MDGSITGCSFAAGAVVSGFFFGASCGAGAFGVSRGAEAVLVFGAEEAEEAALSAFGPSAEDCAAFCSLLCAIPSKMRPKIAGKKNPMVSNSAGPLLKSMNSFPVMMAQIIASAWIT